MRAGHLLVTGGPGSGKTTVSILKAAKLARESLPPEARVLFLSFARATVFRVLEAIDEERQIRLSILKPSNESIALSAIRSEYKAASKLSDVEKAEKLQRENDERSRLAHEAGLICFDLFAP